MQYHGIPSNSNASGLIEHRTKAFPTHSINNANASNPRSRTVAGDITNATKWQHQQQYNHQQMTTGDANRTIYLQSNSSTSTPSHSQERHQQYWSQTKGVTTSSSNGANATPSTHYGYHHSLDRKRHILGYYSESDQQQQRHIINESPYQVNYSQVARASGINSTTLAMVSPRRFPVHQLGRTNCVPPPSTGTLSLPVSHQGPILMDANGGDVDNWQRHSVTGAFKFHTTTII